MKWILVFAACAALSGCVMPGDLRELQAVDTEFRFNVQGELDKLKTGKLDEKAFNESVVVLQTKRDADVQRVADQVQARTQELYALVQGVKDGAIDWTSLLGGAGGVTGAGMVLLNLLRNQSRRQEISHLKEAVKT